MRIAMKFFSPLRHEQRGTARRMHGGVLMCCLAWLAPGGHALADTYPSRPVTLVAPFAPGGSGDLIARKLVQAIKESSNTTFVVENRTGAGGLIGNEYVAKAKPDGYTLLMGSDSLLLGPLTRKSVSFSIKDFIPIARVRVANLYLAINADMPVDSVSKLVTLAKDKPGKVHYASGGAATIMHLAGEQFSQKFGVDMTHVPYRGAAPAITATAAGEVGLTWTGAAEVGPFLSAGKVRVLGMMGERRSPAYPSIPTMAELGYDDMTIFSWNGIFAPAGTPPETVKWLIEKITIAANSATFLQNGEAVEIDSQNIIAGEKFGKFLEAQRDRYKAIITKGNIQLQD